VTWFFRFNLLLAAHRCILPVVLLQSLFSLISANCTNMNISYTEFAPSPDLAAYIDCYWLYSFEGAEDEESPVQKCLPTGMLEILIHLDDSVAEIEIAGKWQKLPHDFFTGIYNHPVFLKMTGSMRLFGIRLKPETFPQLFDAPVASLFCDFMDLKSFFGKDIHPLPQALHGLDTVNGIIAHTEAFLSKRLSVMEQPGNYIVDAVNLIRSTKGNISVEQVSNTLSVGVRQLQRSFKESMGASPKLYMRIIRFRNAFACLYDVREWADITHDLGYADQAHFIREFRAFAGKAPNDVFKNANQYYKKPAETAGN
jgi:AraC-like DNA-binding protein